ncbi:MAG: ATP phosphoribosyltransferase [Oscillospiraceae bacterium]|jgi:ATP phosphoribosyltransferase regulatory subunit|nr:ATP phosphoribosyltransferase [Oscillospiraceae bacterium]
MEITENILRYEEKIALMLRSLYAENGYEQYKMSRFEEYEFYSKNKSYLPSGEILTFTDTDGRLMALRPDVTLSIVKGLKNDNSQKKLYYDENIYRSDGSVFKEQLQVGLEYIGDIDDNKIEEVLSLAKKSLDIIADGRKTHLEVFKGDKETQQGDLTYYSNMIFHGYIDGIPKKILSGGRYDELLHGFGVKKGAIGFAVYLDLIEHLFQYEKLSLSNISTPTTEAKHEASMISVALPKGRLGEKAYEMLKNAGYEYSESDFEDRKLVFENKEKGIRYFWVKPSDIAVYVERGVADIGIVGKDILMENNSDVNELLDLKLGKCKMCIAALKGTEVNKMERALRVATKFPNIAKNHYAMQNRDIDIIVLNGSIELAPLLGLSDVIVDLVETGKTLEQNNLVVIETIADISARLIANKSSYKFKKDVIDTLCEKLEI